MVLLGALLAGCTGHSREQLAPGEISEAMLADLKPGMSVRKLKRIAGDPQQVETGYPAKYHYTLRLEKPKPIKMGTTSIIPVMIEVADFEVVAVHRAMVD